MPQIELERLRETATVLRCDVVRMIHNSGSGHPGGSLSAADIVAALYFRILKVDPGNPRDPDRDRFILSKGHCCPVHYAALARRGFFPMSHLMTLRRYKSICQGHPCMERTPGLDMTSGSLGNGLSIGAGMAVAARLDGRTYRVFVMVGDGEMQEGMIWEALMAAAHFRLGNLCLIVDKNRLQVDGPVETIMSIDPLPEKLRSFGWDVREIDGHDLGQVVDALEAAYAAPAVGRPQAVVAHTVKGKAVSFMENEVVWHGMAPNDEQYERALAELGGASEAHG
ncbi:MAG: transketolase [Alicyclobacillus sp.]|nr:transketolase [Alicyclobacillus sp.]